MSEKSKDMKVDEHNYPTGLYLLLLVILNYVFSVIFLIKSPNSVDEVVLSIMDIRLFMIIVIISFIIVLIMQSALEISRNSKALRYTLLVFSFTGCFSGPLFYCAYLLSDNLHLASLSYIVTPVSFSFFLPIFIREMIAARFLRSAACRRFVCCILVILSFAGVFKMISVSQQIGFYLATRVAMCGSFDMETLQAGAVQAIKEQADNVASQGLTILPGWSTTTLAGGSEAVPKTLETAYEAFKPNHVSISNEYGNETSLFFEYGPAEGRPQGLVVGSPTFVFDTAWPKCRKIGDGVYLF